MRTLRFRMPAGYEGEWDINEVQLFSGEDRLFNSPQWTFGGWPNRWEGPLAFDGNLATRWRTWETVRAGMYLRTWNSAIRSASPSAVLVTHTPAFRVPLEIYGLDVQGRWHLLSNTPQAIPRAPAGYPPGGGARRQTRRLPLSAGAHREGGNAPIGNILVGHEAEWGMERAGDAGRFYLLRVK